MSERWCGGHNCWLFRWHRYCLELNWTQLNSFFFLHPLPFLFLCFLQVNSGTVLKTAVEKFLRVRVERIIMAFSGGIDTVSNWTQLNSFFFLHLLPSLFLPLLQVNSGNVLKAAVGKFLRVMVERIIMGFSGGIDTVLKWTQLNSFFFLHPSPPCSFIFFRWTVELFQRQWWEHFSESGWSAQPSTQLNSFFFLHLLLLTFSTPLSPLPHPPPSHPSLPHPSHPSLLLLLLHQFYVCCIQ